jgi:hypothetical protein
MFKLYATEKHWTLWISGKPNITCFTGSVGLLAGKGLIMAVIT